MITENKSLKALLHSVQAVDGQTEANLSPALLGVSQFKPNHHGFKGTSSAPQTVVARQFPLQGDKELGTWFNLNVDEAGQIQVSGVLCTVDGFVNVGYDLQVTDVQWEEAKQLSFKFDFKFTHNSQAYTFSDGQFSIQFD